MVFRFQRGDAAVDAPRAWKPAGGALKPHNIGSQMKHQRISTIDLKGFVLVGKFRWGRGAKCCVDIAKF